MPNAWRSMGLVPFLALLCSCNIVVSEKPWFTEADAAGVPALREGLWVNFDNNDCQFDPQQQISAWPPCARPMMVRDGQYMQPSDKADEPGETIPGDQQWEPLHHLLVAGEPLIDQLDNPEQSTAPDDAQFGHYYAAARIVRTQADGRILELIRWPIVCGPLESKPASKSARKSGTAEPARYVTSKPFPGLAISGNYCLAKDSAALRQAAALSETVAITNGAAKATSRWVRDHAP